MAKTVYRRSVSPTNENWNQNDNWSTTDGGGADTTYPVATDTVYFTENSANTTINTASACAIVDCVSEGEYTGTLTMSADMTTTGDVTFSAGMTFVPNTNTWKLGTCTVTSNGQEFYLIGGVDNQTITLADDMVINGLFTIIANKYIMFNNNSVYMKGGIYIVGVLQGWIQGTSTIVIQGGTVTGTNSSCGYRGTGEVILDGDITFSGYFIISAGTLTYQSGTITTTDHILCLGNCIIDTGKAGFGGWNDVYKVGSSTITVTLTSDLDINGDLVMNTGSSAYKMTFAGAGDVTVAGGLSLTIGDIAGRTITMDGTGTWSAGSSGDLLTSNLVFNTVGTITIGANVYYSTGTITYTAGTVDAATNSSTLNIQYANTTLSTGTGMSWYNISTTLMNAKTLTLGSALQVANDLNLTGTTTHTILACGSNNVTVGGDFTNPRGTAGYTANAGQVFTIGTDGETSVIDGSTNFKNFVVVPGSHIQFDATDDFTCADFVANGTAGDQITMDTDDGNAVDFDATAVNGAGDGKVHYVNAEDIDSAGGAEITTVGGSVTDCVNWVYESGEEPEITYSAMQIGCNF